MSEYRNNKKLSSNIKHLRNAYGETGQQLADFLHCTNSSIGNWESGNGDRSIPIEYLIKIASHYNVSLSELLNEDFSQLRKNDLSDIFNLEWTDYLEFNSYIYLKILHIFPRHPEQKSDLFDEAFSIHTEAMSPSGLETETNFSEVLEKYNRAFLEDGLIEAVANQLSLYLFLWCSALASTSDVYINIENSKSIDLKNSREVLLKAFDKNNIETRIVRKSFLQRYNAKLTGLMEILSRSSEYSDYCYYYLALRYIYGMLDQDITKLEYYQENEVGRQIMHCLLVMKNKYAVEFDNLWDDENNED